ncbi:MAG: S8 family serine peptidase, partial [Nitrospiraceae bacterium]
SNSLEDSPGGQYTENTTSWVGYMTPIASVKDHRYTLSFEWKGEIEQGFDYMDINYSIDGINWDWIDYRTGYEEDFISDQSLELTGVAEMFDSFYFGFGITSDSSINGEGVYLENISITRRPIEISEFNYSSASGTSVAAPFVSGVAGLILAVNPELTSIQVKNKILNSVDKIPALSQKVMSGGRLNAYSALHASSDSSLCDESNDGESASGCVTIRSSSAGTDGSGKGCFIATAAYGSVMHPYVKELQRFRDIFLLTNAPGKALVQFYYTYSPPLADYIRDREDLRLLTRIILAPLIILIVYPYKILGISVLMIVGLLIPGRRKNS